MVFPATEREGGENNTWTGLGPILYLGKKYIIMTTPSLKPLFQLEKFCVNLVAVR